MELHAYTSSNDLPASLRSHVRGVPGTRYECLHHPFLVELFPIGLPCPVDEMISIRAAHAEEELARGRTAGYLFTHQRPYRMQALTRLVQRGHFRSNVRSAIRFWRLARSIWMDCEDDESSIGWGLLLASPLPCRQAMTSSRDRRAFRALPDTITIYRGLQAIDETSARDAACVGYSWSVSPDTARFFARRHLRPDTLGWVAETSIPRASAIAHLTQRGEGEVIVDSSRIDPDHIRITELPVVRKSSPEMVSLRAFFSE